MEIRQIFVGKEQYMPLLLLADEQEDMIARYLPRGELYVLGDPAQALCVVTDEGGVWSSLSANVTGDVITPCWWALAKPRGT